MSVYLDTSAIVSIFVKDLFTGSVRAYLAREQPSVIVSDFGAAEFASAAGLRVRRGTLSLNEAKVAFGNFDAWRERRASTTLCEPEDIEQAARYLRRLDLTLRTPDAIHIAIAARLGAELLTFDTGMAACAKTLGVAVAQV